MPIKVLYPEYDASGLPISDHPSWQTPSIDPDRGVPCIGDMCNGVVSAVGEAYCAACLGGVTDRNQPPSPPEVIELGIREYHLVVARRLRQLGCTHSQLRAMHRQQNFATAHHHSLWLSISGTIDERQLDRANFVLDLIPEQVVFDVPERYIERLERNYPADRLTGAPHHFIVNGDHSGCGCDGHSTSCTTWDTQRHAPTLCGANRTACDHTPRHTYGQPCGRTTEGKNVYGPAQS